ncbi:Ferrichrome-iron receptor [Paraburkholderia unamae]|uniref:TonB-dependent siderophore receptor n=1 Tax=Paraburkholderia unamae TaxID=219649 RepID=UPI001CB42A1E|nr:TonB-dependent siderophore receptor [Paraburkholderia unamae]CAG9269425.1 Ferrichrome-iron receptor [Paraburkholderia unamae]
MKTGVGSTTAIALLLYLLGGGGAALAQTANDNAQGAASDGATDAGKQLPAVKVSNRREQTTTGTSDGYVPITAVTATKTDTPLIETPQSVSVVTRDQMTDQNAQTVTEALRYTASVTSEIRGASAAGAPYLMSRGFYLEQFLDGARQPSDISFGYAIPAFDPYGLERIDVLHGPASVLYGQANPGGVANLVSKQPTTTPVHEVFFTTGSHNRAEGGFDLGGAINQDGSLSYRLTGTANRNDTQVDGAKQSHVYIAPAITWKPDANTTLTVLAKYQRDPDVGYYNFVPAMGSLFETPNGRISTHTNLGDPNFDSHSRTQASVGYQFEHRFNDVWTFRQNLRYTYVRDDFSNVFANGFSDDSATTLNRYAFFNDESAKFFTVDNQAQAKFSTGPVSHTALFGFDYQRVLYRERVGLGAAPQLDPFAPVYQSVAMPNATSDDNIRMTQFGVYAQDQLAWNRWRFLIGVRQDWASSDDNNPVTASYTSQSARAFTWRTGLVYLFDNGFAPYASFAKSFNPQAGVLADGSAARPTTAEQYEVGVKYQPRGYNSFITASVFDLRERNVLTSDPANPGFSTQAGQVRARGFELQGQASLSDDLNITASYTYLNNVTTDSNDSATTIDGGTTPLQGKTTWGIPRNVAAAWIDYTLHGGSLRGLGFGGGVRYLGSSYDESNTIRVPSVTLIDAAIHYDTGRHWLLSLNGTNLFNRQYVASCFSANTCTYGDGVEVLATARYRW